MIAEVIKVLDASKELIVELRVKDHLIREIEEGKDCFLGRLVEAEIGKMAVREFENS